MVCLSICAAALAWRSPALLAHAAQPHPRSSLVLVAEPMPVVEGDVKKLTLTPPPPPPTAVPINSPRLRAAIIGSLAFVSGFADIICFLRYDAYGNMMTGNWLRFASTAGNLRWLDSTYWLAIVVTYLGGIGIHRAVDRRVSTRGSTASCAALAPLVWALFASVDLLHCMWPATRWTMLLLACGFGVVNAVASEATGSIICSAHSAARLLEANCRTISDAAVSALPAPRSDHWPLPKGGAIRCRLSQRCQPFRQPTARHADQCVHHARVCGWRGGGNGGHNGSAHAAALCTCGAVHGTGCHFCLPARGLRLAVCRLAAQRSKRARNPGELRVGLDRDRVPIGINIYRGKYCSMYI